MYKTLYTEYAIKKVQQGTIWSEVLNLFWIRKIRDLEAENISYLYDVQTYGWSWRQHFVEFHDDKTDIEDTGPSRGFSNVLSDELKKYLIGSGLIMIIQED